MFNILYTKYHINYLFLINKLNFFFFFLFKKKRIIRNRASANASRQKKKEYIESLEKKNKELTQHNEKIDKENQKLKDENENLKLQIQYLSQTINKMNTFINKNEYNTLQNIQNVQAPNILNINNNGIYSSPKTENNFTSGINSFNQLNSPDSLSSSSPLFNITQSIPSNNNNLTNLMNNNVSTSVNDMNVLSLQSSVGEPAALTNENSLQRTLFCRRIMQQILQTIILTKFLTNFLMAAMTLIIRNSAYRPLNNNNNYKNLYQKRNYTKIVPISAQNSTLNYKLQEVNYHKNNYFNYWNNKYTYWKDKMS